MHSSLGVLEKFLWVYCPNVTVFLVCGGNWHVNIHHFVWKLVSVIHKFPFIHIESPLEKRTLSFNTLP